MAYAIGGTALILQPTSGRWMPREMIGRDGSGRPIYAPLRQFQMTWNIMSIAEFDQLQNFFLGIGNTGSYVVSLPEWGGTAYSFYNYSGCIIDEPEMDVYFNEFGTRATLLIARIFA